MPDISTTELRRLEALSDRIVRVDERRRTATEQRDAARAEVKDLKATIRAMRRTATENDRTIEALQEQVADLVAENREQAVRLETAKRSEEQATTAALKLADVQDDLKGQLTTTKGNLREANKQVNSLQKKIGTLEKQVTVLEGQVAATDLPVFLPADKVGELLDDFVTQFDVGGMQITDGEVRLNVAFASGADGAAFVIPSTAAEEQDLPLHTVNLKLGPRPPGLGEVG